MITERTQKKLDGIRRREHGGCVLCDRAGDLGLRLEFEAWPDGSVRASFPCDRCFQGYDGLLHGGVISLLLDGAMTNCLFARGVSAVTAEMSIRYHRPVSTGTRIEIEARVRFARPPLHLVEAELTQRGIVSVRAKGKFIERRAEKAATPDADRSAGGHEPECREKGAASQSTKVR